MGRLFVVNLEGQIYSCKHCRTHLALYDDIISKVGWKYETAHEKNQKYKEGKSVLERFKVLGPDESSYWVSHEADAGGSEGDDV